VLVAVAFVGLNARVMVAVVSLIVNLIRADVPLTSGDVGILGLAAPLCFSVFGAMAPWFGRRYGLEATIIAALLITSLGEVGRASATSPAWFIAWTVPALAGAGMGNVIAPPLIKKYFPDRVTVVTTVYTVFTTLSTSLPPLLILRIAQATGWRFSVRVWAVVGLCGVIPWAMIVFHSDRAGQRLAAIKRRLDPRTLVPRPAALSVPLWRTSVAWGLTATFAVNCVIGYTMFAWLPQMLQDAGVTVAHSDFLLAVFASGSLPGALLTPWLIAHVRPTWVLPAVFTVAYAVSFTMLMLHPGQSTLLWLLVSRIGDCYFAYTITMINLRTRTTRGSIRLSGFVQPLAYAIACVGPWGFGLLHTATGAWHVPMVAILACLPVQLVGGVIVARSKPVDV